MFEADIDSQLKDLFKDLSDTITIQVYSSQHSKQQELLTFLHDFASTSEHIQILHDHTEKTIPQFKLFKNGQETGIGFVGIPGGHEFTSLILAVLNIVGKGKLPDEALIKRIKKLKKNLVITTYMSLSCENCPDVVQALNQIAISHGSITHTTIDGELVQDQLAAIGIQGVPAVCVDNQLIHSGRGTLSEILNKLAHLYSEPAIETAASSSITELGEFDVAVIGGGPAGAAAAIYTVRKGLKTALIADKIGGQMTQTKGIENFIGTNYTEGLKLSADLDKHMSAYPIQIFENRRVVKAHLKQDIKRIEIEGQEALSAKSVIIATGAKWRELSVPGEKDYIGRGVAFCPHCDGPYYKGKKIAVVGGGNSGVEAAIDLANICSHVTLVEFSTELRADKVLIEKMEKLPNITILKNAKTTEIIGNNDRVVAFHYEDRATKKIHTIDLDGVFVQIGLSPNSAFVKDILTLSQTGEIVVDEKGRTSLKNVYAAGDVTTIPFKQIIIAMGDGAKAALTAFEDRMKS